MYKATVRTVCVVFLMVLSGPLAFGQTKRVEAKNLPDHPFQVEYPSGSQLTVYLRSGDVRVVGTNDNRVSVRVDTKNLEKARQVKVVFDRSDKSAELRISGGPKNDTQIVIEVPKASGLFVRMPAGQLEISDIIGDKDLQIHAGELIVHVGDPADYSHVDASVTTGDIDAPPFHEDHGGFFRSFHKDGQGKYKLHAHVGAGDLTLR